MTQSPFYFDFSRVKAITDEASYLDIWTKIKREGQSLGAPKKFTAFTPPRIAGEKVVLETLSKGTRTNCTFQIASDGWPAESFFQQEKAKHGCRTLSCHKPVGFIPLGYSEDFVYVAFAPKTQWDHNLNMAHRSPPLIYSMNLKDLGAIVAQPKKPHTKVNPKTSSPYAL